MIDYLGPLLLLFNFTLTDGPIVFGHLFRRTEVYNRVFEGLLVIRPSNPLFLILFLQIVVFRV
jgi:hypothetical protein